MRGTRRWRRLGGTSGGLALAFALLLAGAGCGTGAGGSDDGPAPLPDDTYRRVLDQGVAPELVHTIELAGFELAEQSAGVIGDADFGAVYVRRDTPLSAEVYLEVRVGDYDARRCGSEPLRGPSGAAPVAVESCEPDADGWFRTGGDWQEYVVSGAGQHLTVGATSAEVDREALVDAALGARGQDGATLAPRPPPTPPSVTRGDLPTTGDGAPVDPFDPSTAGG